MLKEVPAITARPTEVDVGCASPSAINELLKDLVKQYGQRWHLIRCNIQKAFSVAIPAHTLERRWLESQSERSPLAVISADGSSQCANHARSGSVRGCDRPLKEDAPLSSPPATAGRELLASSRCPVLLSPDSSLAAPDAVRRELKAVYLAALLKRSRPDLHSPWPEDGGVPGTSGAVSEAAATDGGAESSSRVLSPSDDEKGAVVSLLAREIGRLPMPIGVSPSRNPDAPKRRRDVGRGRWGCELSPRPSSGHTFMPR